MQRGIVGRLATWGLLMAALWGAAARGTTAAERPQIAECHIGFDGHVKVGYWMPVRVGISGDVSGKSWRVEVTTIDSDGVPVSTSAPVEFRNEPTEDVRSLQLYTRVGRLDAPVSVRLLGDDDAVVSQLELAPHADVESTRRFHSLSATSELIVQVGTSAIGMDQAFHTSAAENGQAARTLVRTLDVDALPGDWFGYESVDVLVLTTSDGQMIRQLTADERRFAAMRQWLELGGRLVVMGGGDHMPELLGDGAPLAELIPGQFAEVVRLTETGPLQHYAGSEAAIAESGGRATIMVPQIAVVQGNIEVYSGRRPSDLPIVVRTARGLGEVAFVGVDLGAAPLSGWPGRAMFLQAVFRPYLSQQDEGEAAQSLVARGYNDLSGALRQRLGRSFAGVVPITFAIVAVLAVAYLVVLGPLDYLFVHRWLRRPWVAWISFPLVVLGFALAAMALADWQRVGVGARVNQLELVDIDAATGQARGTYWATLYSPRAARFDVALAVAMPGQGEWPESNALLSWWGLPGVGVGGMSGGADIELIPDGYRYGPQERSLLGLPLLTSSTKSLLGRWTAPASISIEAELVDKDGLVEGFVENRTGMPLGNVRLLYNGWAYRLGNLQVDSRLEIGDEISPRRVKTIVIQEALGPTPPGQADGHTFAAGRATAEETLSLMMFYTAAGGFGFAHIANEYQAYCDLSRLLELGRAILVADAPTAGSRLVDAGSGEPIAADMGTAAVMYRFVLPVGTELNGQ